MQQNTTRAPHGQALEISDCREKNCDEKTLQLIQNHYQRPIYSKILDYAKNKLPWTNTLAYLALPSMTKKKYYNNGGKSLKNFVV